MNEFIIQWYSRSIFNFQPFEIKQLFRKIERKSKQLITNNLHQEFNNKCLNENLLPIYTNFKLHDAAAREEDFVIGCRRQLILRQIREQEAKKQELTEQISTLENQLKTEIATELQYLSLNCFLDRILNKTKKDLISKHERKLNQLYGEPLFYKQNKDSYINLTEEEIDPAIDRVFSLGMNCHLKTKFEHNKTKIEIEKLFNNIKAAEKEKKVTIKNEERLTCELKRFGLKERRDFTKDLITKEEYNKIREFIRNDNIIIRKADKNNTFVIMDKNEYIRQLTHLLSNPSKFQRINSDPTEAIKRKLNSLIAKGNKNSTIFSKITGHFEPGYI